MRSKQEREQESSHQTASKRSNRIDLTSFVHSLGIVVLRCELSVVVSVFFLFFFLLVGDFLVFLGDDIALAAAAAAAASISVEKRGLSSTPPYSCGDFSGEPTANISP